MEDARGDPVAWNFKVLVVANVTAEAPELIQALKERASRDTCAFTLLVPAPAAGSVGREAARERLDSGLAAMRKAGLEIDGLVGDHDPIAAVHDAWDPTEFDEVVISTLPTGASKWLQVDLPHRVEKLTGGSQVTHVVAEPPRPEPHTTPAPQAERHGVLAPLMAAFTGKR
jgi:hypothetical protein